MRRPRGPAKWGELWIVRVIGGVRWVWRRDPWRGISPPVPTPLCAYCGCQECREAELEVEALKKPAVRSEVAVDPTVRVEVPRMLVKLPTVADLLLQPTWEDGTPKDGAALFVFPSFSSVRLLVKVGCPALKLPVLGRTWDEAWAALEAILKGDDIPWEQDNGPTQKAAKKRKGGG